MCPRFITITSTNTFVILVLHICKHLPQKNSQIGLCCIKYDIHKISDIVFLAYYSSNFLCFLPLDKILKYLIANQTYNICTILDHIGSFLRKHFSKYLCIGCLNLEDLHCLCQKIKFLWNFKHGMTFYLIDFYVCVRCKFLLN